MTHLAPFLVWAVGAGVVMGVILRPLGWADWVWALAGAVVLALLRVLSPGEVVAWAGRGTDVYLFLIGMMMLSELARREGLFDWVAAVALRAARGSRMRLFVLVYAVGAGVTVLLSNDATAVVLTPAVAAVVRTAGVPAAPYLLACAFVANAASFVLPISNPANLVLYGDALPALGPWLVRFAVPSVLSIGATGLVLWMTQRRALAGGVPGSGPERTVLPAGGRVAAAGIVVTAWVLLVASAQGADLGWPTFAAGLVTALVGERFSPRRFGALLRPVAWGVLPLVAGLFVLVGALEKTGSIAALAALVRGRVVDAPGTVGWEAGVGVALANNLLNNLPAGLVAARVAVLAQVPDTVRAALLIGVDLGPNLSVTGSLATLLWLGVLRREGVAMSAWRFLAVGAVVMPPALLLALAAVLLPPFL